MSVTDASTHISLCSVSRSRVDGYSSKFLHLYARATRCRPRGQLPPHTAALAFSVSAQEVSWECSRRTEREKGERVKGEDAHTKAGIYESA